MGETFNSKRLKRARLEAGLTRTELATAARVAVRTLCNYERGLRTPDANVIWRIAAVTGQEMRWFFVRKR